MEPQTGCRIVKVFDVEKKLTFRFLDIVRPSKKLANLRKRKDGHHEGIVPKLVVVNFGICDVLHTTESCSG
jgi:hypothetical protein